ncbi:HNH endonuclease [Nocardia sp. IBHARD005]|uniref:HNH endonuclease n=1 Tax=Nocardia sp. IBHARD005 TaxID=3457765 RepID=UPI004059E9B8
MAIYEVWGSKCYLCTQPKDYNDIEIDHILPKTASQAQLRVLVSQLASHEGTVYDVHDPYNLAPICGPCNVRKRDIDLTRSGIFATYLHLAQERRAQVARRVETFATAGKVSKSLLVALKANIRDPAARKALDRHGPAIIQKFALMDPAVAEGYVIHRELAFEDRNICCRVHILLDNVARRAIQLLEDVAGARLESVLDDPIRDLEDQLVEHIREALHEFPEIIDAPQRSHLRGTIDVGIESVVLDRQGTEFEFRFRGDYEANLSAPTDVTSEEESHMQHADADARCDGTILFAAWWNPAKDRELESSDCTISISYENYQIEGTDHTGSRFRASFGTGEDDADNSTIY